MYCIKCGARLSDKEAVCPLCKTAVYHPDYDRESLTGSYPRKDFKSEELSLKGILFVITVISALIFILPSLFELWVYKKIEWSGYVSGGITLFYVWVFLPLWFKKPNPVIFVPCDFAAAALFLFYINFTTDGNWFFTFALPVTFALCLIVSALIALCRYIRRGHLYIFGGFTIALGAWCVLIDLLVRVTFDIHARVYWSAFPLLAFFMLGMMLIVIAIVKPLKESLRKIFFIG